MFCCEGVVLEVDDILNGCFYVDGLMQYWFVEKIIICLN